MLLHESQQQAIANQSSICSDVLTLLQTNLATIPKLGGTFIPFAEEIEAGLSLLE
jgi:hypothetical protein